MSAKADQTRASMPVPFRVDNSESTMGSYGTLKLGIEVHMLRQLNFCQINCNFFGGIYEDEKIIINKSALEFL